MEKVRVGIAAYHVLELLLILIYYYSIDTYFCNELIDCIFDEPTLLEHVALRMQSLSPKTDSMKEVSLQMITYILFSDSNSARERLGICSLFM